MQSDNTAPRRRPGTIRRMLALLSIALSGCAVADSRTAETAQHSLIGWSKLAVETCLGAPAHESNFGGSDILTYGATSTDSHVVSVGLPFVIGISIAGGGYCSAIVRLQGGRVAEVRYIGETNAFLMASDAYCAPLVRRCVEHPPHLRAAVGAAAATDESINTKIVGRFVRFLAAPV
jgi:hypothetical protein